MLGTVQWVKYSKLYGGHGKNSHGSTPPTTMLSCYTSPSNYIPIKKGKAIPVTGCGDP
jgi:hypothetical protein